MRTTLKRWPALALGAALLAGCTATGPGNLRVHEAVLSGGANQRIGWVYGSLSGGSSSLKLNGAAVDVRAQVADDLATPGSLSVNGKATYQINLAAPAQKLSVTRDAAGRFNVSALNSASLLAVYYTDGTNWWKLNGTSGNVSATPTNGLRGAGQLTDDEGDALARALDGQGSLAVAVLSESLAPLSVEPKPTEHRVTSLYVLPGVGAAPPAGTTTGTVTMTTNPAAGSGVSGDGRFTEVARGTNATATSAAVRVATTTAQLADIYRVAYGNQTPVPTPAALSGETAVAVFMGQRSSGGYSVSVERVAASGGTLTVTVSLRAPQPGSMTTMALTSPWVLVTVPGVYSTVNVVDTNGQPLR